MRLETVSVYNFRCLKEVKNVPIHNLTVLIGENDAGKSSILDAIGLALEKNKPVPDDYYIRDGQAREQEIIIELLFAYDGDEEQPEEQYLNADGKLQYRVKHTPNSISVDVYGKRFTNTLLNQDVSKLKAGEFDEMLSQLGITFEGRLNAEKRMQLFNGYIENENPEVSEDWIVVKNQIDNFLPRFEKYSTAEFKNPEIMIQKTLQTVVEAKIYQYDEEQQKKILSEPLRKVREDLKNSLDVKIAELLNHVQRYNTKVSGLEIEPIIDFAKGFQTGKLYLTDSTGSYHVDNKGEGTKKRLFMSILDWDRKVMLETDSRPVIRAYDEPDANLHYEAQRKMYYTLRDITHRGGSKIQALICTHSLTMIDRAPAKNINLLKLDEWGKCSVTYLRTNDDGMINEFLCDMSRSMGIPNSSIFYERCFIFVEGPTEENALPIIYTNLFKSSIVEDGIKIINIEGCGSWENFVKLMGINKKDLMLFLLDTDCNEEESSCTLNEETLTILGFEPDFIDNKVVYVGTKEFEDAFKSSIYVQILNHLWPKTMGALWTEEDIDNLKSTEKFSKSLVEEVWRQSRLKGERKCTKPKLGAEIAKHCRSEEDIPKDLVTLLKKAREIAEVI
jgi:predicted ATP-dependent endonuclease of OLD family